MDFQADLRRFALEQLEHYGVKYRKKDDLTTLLIKLYTFFEKYIVPREREVLMARELEEKLPRLPPSVREALDKLAELVRGGVDVNCFQSRGLYGQGSRDYQNMLYGIVHLHLSAKETDTEPVVKEGKRFAKPGATCCMPDLSRTGPISWTWRSTPTAGRARRGPVSGPGRPA